MVNQGEELFTRDQVKFKAAILFVAQAKVELGLWVEGQNALNFLYESLQIGSSKNDDTLYLQALTTNQKIAVKMQQDP